MCERKLAIGLRGEGVRDSVGTCRRAPGQPTDSNSPMPCMFDRMTCGLPKSPCPPRPPACHRPPSRTGPRARPPARTPLWRGPGASCPPVRPHGRPPTACATAAHPPGHRSGAFRALPGLPSYRPLARPPFRRPARPSPARHPPARPGAWWVLPNGRPGDDLPDVLPAPEHRPVAAALGIRPFGRLSCLTAGQDVRIPKISGTLLAPAYRKAVAHATCRTSFQQRPMCTHHMLGRKGLSCARLRGCCA